MKLTFNYIGIMLGSLTALATGCGVTESSSLDIRGGAPVTLQDGSAIRLSTVALTTDYTTMMDDGRSFCTGTIIGPRTIVTAAHCLQDFDDNTLEKGGPLLPLPSDFIVFFGLDVGDGGDYVRAAEIIPHPDWSPAETLTSAPSFAPNDIGLIILSESIPSYMSSVEIADFSIDVTGRSAHLAGYGVTLSRYATNDTGILRTIVSTFTADNKSIARVEHGALFEGICAGDSGGPAYVEAANGELLLVGAASTGYDSPFYGCLGRDSTSTDVRYYVDWIAANSAVSFD